MPRITKSKTTEVVAETPAPVVETPVAPVATESKPKKVRAPKTPAAPADIAPVEQKEVVASEPVVASESSSEDVALNTIEQSNELALLESSMTAEIQELTTRILALKTKYRAFVKKVSRELKVAQKKSQKRKSSSNPRKVSGFRKPTLISDELASFLEKPAGTIMARTDVTRFINKYIVTNNLKNPENGRFIFPDEKLAVLLNHTKDSVPLSYFNLQKFIKHHFIKTVEGEVVAPVEQVVA
jgi:chromatin remodeling complex protein RSC6